MSESPNVFADTPWDFEAAVARIRGRRIADPAGARELGATVYELEPGDVVASSSGYDRTETLANLSGEAARVLAVSTPRFPEIA